MQSGFDFLGDFQADPTTNYGQPLARSPQPSPSLTLTPTSVGPEAMTQESGTGQGVILGLLHTGAPS